MGEKTEKHDTEGNRYESSEAYHNSYRYKSIHLLEKSSIKMIQRSCYKKKHRWPTIWHVKQVLFPIVCDAMAVYISADRWH